MVTEVPDQELEMIAAPVVSMCLQNQTTVMVWYKYQLPGGFT